MDSTGGQSCMISEDASVQIPEILSPKSCFFYDERYCRVVASGSASIDVGSRPVSVES